jgi:hypothetical protein
MLDKDKDGSDCVNGVDCNRVGPVRDNAATVAPIIVGEAMEVCAVCSGEEDAKDIDAVLETLTLSVATASGMTGCEIDASDSLELRLCCII